MSKTKKNRKRYNKHSRPLSVAEQKEFESSLMFLVKEFMKQRNITKTLVVFLGTGFDLVFTPDREENFNGEFKDIYEGLCYYMLKNNLLRLALKLDNDTDTLQKIELKAKKP